MTVRRTSTDAPPWRATGRKTLLRGGCVYSAADPFATAILLDGDTVAWVGSEGAALAAADGVDEVIDLDGALVTPAFVDAHVHLTTTGMALLGLDLSGVDDRGEALRRIARHAAAHGPDDLVYGHGWDETRWSDPRVPLTREVEDLVDGRPLFVTRIDVHSCLVSAAFLDRHPQLRQMPGYDGGPVLRREAHYAARSVVLHGLRTDERQRAQRAARDRAARLGIAMLTEMSGPQIATAEDLTALLDLSNDEPGPIIVGYWGEGGGARRAIDLGAVGAGGDLFIDGAIGTRTAAMTAPYTDAAHTCGTAYLDADAVAEHVIECTGLGLQAGFHAIGDLAMGHAIDGFRRAADACGVERVRALRHRIEHAEVVTEDHLRVMADLGLVASVQPMFDGLWGGPAGMYAARLGERWSVMNPFARMAALGVALAFSSDAPVTELGPWAAVRAAVNHHNRDQRLSARAAFTAHSRGGWRAAGRPDAGALVPGAPAHLAVWAATDLVVQAPDDRIQAWSTDIRSGTPGLPDMSPGTADPRCLATVAAGRFVHRDGL